MIIIFDKILGLTLVILGYLWLRYAIKNPTKPNDIFKNPMNWVANFQSYWGSAFTIFLGLLFLFGLVSLFYLGLDRANQTYSS